MSFYIGIEDLAANAIIEIISEQTEITTPFVTYKALEEYGAEVINILMQKDEKAVLILSRDNTRAMFHNYSDFFEEKINEKGLGISLKSGVSIDTLINTFRGYLAWDVLLAFINEKSVNKLRACI